MTAQPAAVPDDPAYETSGSTAPHVTAVVVTYNRRPLLLESVAAVLAQTRRPDTVIVVDNASDDGSADAVRTTFSGIEPVVLTRNTGGAGGFALGTAMALAGGADLVWLLDDDTVPQRDALRALLLARDRFTGPRPALLASRVVWTDGRDHPMNTPRRRPFAGRRSVALAAEAGCVPIRSASFASTLVDAAATRRLGLPRADYFLWNDDFEFTTRLLRHDVGLLCRDSVAVHKTRTFGGTDVDPGDRFFYEVRNKIWTLTAPGTLGVVERLLYSGSTVRRWIRTFTRSRDRVRLGRALLAGVRAGVRTRPRPTREVLSEIGYPFAEDPS